ncbi:unnamed protein product [Zymoseptoria tritici ST99CH_1A5]|uniref:Invertebrate defensins family profile domain-containing protein n=3 Tax=Zymoseptoria tritici TaxID=1047171 RepID=A0A1X7RM32_ZYMT9|nr:unnamed protein product [Zymoseptoria tritici ST99CH_3D7]SMR46590.1 unnamed protein product [Zymoseptoria tritici ST99CH_1E4]SMR47832.1 unnamed protein product [Zymoseptoria tritici ST99CH_3D1]SMY21739.1 unnamed protein product [Zymoseptoria tritici ST99CH_1A5]
MKLSTLLAAVYVGLLAPTVAGFCSQADCDYGCSKKGVDGLCDYKTGICHCDGDGTCNPTDCENQCSAKGKDGLCNTTTGKCDCDGE